MNKVITDGLELTPSPFADGLNVWSSGNGTPGSDTYAGSGNGAFVPADQDFGGCLELVKTTATTQLRFMGDTPILPGCYIQVKARVKCMSGALPDVRIAAWAGKPGGAHLNGVTEVGPSVSFTAHGDVVEVSAIIGTGQRTGVDMAWPGANFGHVGLDFTGPNGAVLRVDDLEVTDVTGAFLRDMLGIVDVRDYGAVGDGVTDDAAAFEAADRDADGREVLITEGHYFLGSNVTFQSQVRFQGTVTMNEDTRLIFQKNFDYPTYVDAFGNEELAFKKAIQALLNFSDHESLDLCGRRISLSEPVDVHRAVANRDVFEVRRVIRNGQLQPIAGPAWNDDVTQARATYSASRPKVLTNVENIAAIQAGSLVTGNGVGRDVYVKSVNVAAREVTLSQELYDAAGTQRFTFTRFKYLLDFSGFTKHSDMILDTVELRCNGLCSGVLLAPAGDMFQLHDCQFIKPKDRGLTSHGRGCQSLTMDRCNFESFEASVPSHLRQSSCFNVNANDAKIRNNRCSRLRYFGVLNGVGHLIANNHWFNGDDETEGVRVGGLILTQPNPVTTITGNYIDNNSIEWTNEHDATPDRDGYSFGSLTIVGNIFVTIGVHSSFRWIIVKPHGSGHFISGLSVQGNVFRTILGRIDRVETVDTTHADLDYDRFRNILFEGNAFNGVDQQTRNPYVDTFQQNTADRTWRIGTNGYLPFNGRARTVPSVMPIEAIRNSGNTVRPHVPYARVAQGLDKSSFDLIWPESVKGKVQFTVRADNPA